MNDNLKVRVYITETSTTVNLRRFDKFTEVCNEVMRLRPLYLRQTALNPISFHLFQFIYFTSSQHIFVVHYKHGSQTSPTFHRTFVLQMLGEMFD